MKRIFTSLLIGISLIVILRSYLFDRNDESEGITSRSHNISGSQRIDGHQAQEELPKTQNCKAMAPLYDPSKWVSFQASTIDEQLKNIAYNTPQKLDSKANDISAALALFRMLSSCSVSQSAPGQWVVAGIGCPNTELKGLTVNHPIELLRKAAERGAPDAMLMFALNAPIVAVRFRRMNTVESLRVAADLMQDSEKFGIAAAQLGSPEALRFMSQSYRTGFFGARDPVRAYSYALPLKIIGTAEDNSYLSSMEQHLSLAQRKEAENAVFGCGGRPNSIVSSPFG
jgi:hypothetical protein